MTSPPAYAPDSEPFGCGTMHVHAVEIMPLSMLYARKVLAVLLPEQPAEQSSPVKVLGLDSAD
jgi:hypothetical protein